MRIARFEIRNYRAIDSIDIDMNYSINPIIGVNESGKTSVLKAILCIDKKRDKLNKGNHLEYQNKYSTKPTYGSQVSAEIYLDNSEIENLIKSLKLSTDSNDFKIVNKFNKKSLFKISRLLSHANYPYDFEDPNLTENTRSKIAKHLVSQLPYILYFDDFSDRVPNEIVFPEDYQETGKLTRNKLREWQDIIEEIFRRANPEGLENDETPLQAYMNIEDKDRKDDVLSDIEDELNTEIISEWKRIKKSGKAFADDSEKLNLVLQNDGKRFLFKVRDKSNQDKRRTFTIGERSKGFQWFFNYMIKLKYNPNYKKKLENSIFLLDEPGSYLHSAAQTELLNELNRVSDKNIIVYCTHSQYLLNPSVIKLGSIKIAEKKKSKITLTGYGSYGGTKDKNALSPIYQALQLNFANDYLGRLVIVEGITDYYLFNIIQKHSKLIDKDVKFIPGAGAAQSSTLISLALPFSDDFVVMLDNDKAGIKAYKRYLKEFGDHIERKLYLYNESSPNFLLEDFLSSSDQNNLLKITNTTDLKRAMGFLFYDYKKEQKVFINALSTDTKNNLKDCLTRMNEMHK